VNVIRAAMAVGALVAMVGADAAFTTPPTATIAHWRNNATAAYSLMHDDACDAFKGPSPPAHGTYGLFDHWQEAAQRGLPIGIGAIGSECLYPPETLTFLKATLAAHYELISHSYFHCDHTLAPSACMVWSDAANGGAGGEVPLPTAYPELQLDTRQKLIDYEMGQSKSLFGDPSFSAAAVNFYAFPEDHFDSLAVSRLAPAGYLGARGGNRALGNINRWNIDPDPASGDELIDFHVLFDEYNANDVMGNPANTSDYDPPSLANYLNDVVTGGLGGWGMQVLHGIADLSFGTVGLALYQSHLDTVLSLQSQGKLWVATPTDVIKYRRTNYHCGDSRGVADAVVTIGLDGNLQFAGLADPKCAVYATVVTVAITLPAGVDAITATQNGQALGVMATATPGKVLLNANPMLGVVNIQPVAGPQAPVISSAATTTFTVGVPGAFVVTATGNPAPTFSVAGVLPAGLALNPITGVLSGTPLVAGTYLRNVSAANSVPPNAIQAFTLVVNKGNQAIAFAPFDGLNLAEVDSIGATATSGLPVSFSSATPSVCTVSNIDVTVTGIAVGACTIHANQVGDLNWNAAPTATLTFFVKGNQAITFGAAPALVVGGTGGVSASATSNLPVAFTSWIPDICTISGNVVTGVAVGDCVIAANQGGSDFYHPANEVTQTFAVGKGSQTIAFGAAPSVAVGGVGAVSAIASSGLSVVFSSKTSGTCSVAGNVVSAIAVGSCTIAANQDGGSQYQPAPEVTQTFAVTANTGNYGLTVLKFGDGGGTVTSTPAGIDCGSHCAANFDSRTPVALTAAPAAGSVFTGWGGACAGKAPCNLTMDEAKIVGANFVLSANAPRLANLSTRGQVLTGNDVMIAGFIIGGATAKTLVVTVAGPSLANFGIANPLANPTLTLVRSSDNSVIATNDDWQGAANAAQIQASGFAPSNALEPAIMMTLAPGAYTAIVQGTGGTGTGLVGVFEVDHPEAPLINISTRGQVLTGNDVMIAGFIIQGSSPQTVVINVAGPSLANFGITNPLANPTLTLVRSSDNAVIATNDNWQSASNAAQIQASGFAPSNALEPAIMMTLAPGAYTAIVQGAGGGTGVGLVGVFTTP